MNAPAEALIRAMSILDVCSIAINSGKPVDLDTLDYALLAANKFVTDAYEAVTTPGVSQ